MREDVKKRWVDALRSGEFQKTTHCLRGKHGFCCLGVLTQLFINEDPEHRHFREEHEDCSEGHVNILTGRADLHRAVMEWAGLSNPDPIVPAEAGHGTTLSYLNDNGMSFAVIADVIERDL